MSPPRAPLAFLQPLGRVLYAFIFLYFAPSMFGAAAAAKATSNGVPLAGVAVPIGGVLALAGALSLIAGYKPRAGALLIVAFLLPVTFSMHAFWRIPDAGAAMVQKVMFLKNLSMLGAALVFVTQGASGPLSLDAWLARRADARPR